MFFSENSDFTGSMWQVDFPAGATEARFSIPIVRDNLPENSEEFSLKIVIGTPANQRVTVGDPNGQRVIIRAIITGTYIL